MSESRSAPVPPRLPSLQLRGLRPEQMLSEVERWAADLIRTIEGSLGESVAQKLGSAYAEMQGSLVLAGDASEDLEAVPLRMLRAAEQAAQDQIAAKVAKAGDTMTGNLAISRTATAAVLTLEASDPRQRRVDFKTGGASRWSLTASNAAGEPLVLTAYDDTGTLIGNAYTVDRLTRSIAFQGAVNANGGDDTTPAISASSGTGAAIRRGLTLTRTVAGDIGHSIEWVMGQSPNNLPRVSITGKRSTKTGILTIATANSSEVMVDRLTITDAGSTFSHPVNATAGINVAQNTWINLGGTSGIIKDGAGNVVHTYNANQRHWWSNTDGAWRWQGGTAYNIDLMTLTAGGNLWAPTISSGWLSSAGQVRAYSGVSFADSGPFSNAMQIGWDPAGGTGAVPVAVNWSFQGYLTRSFNVVVLTSMSDGTGPYLQYRDSSGNAFGARAFASDERLKENIEPVNDAFLPLIRAIKPRAFDWQQKGPNGETLHNPLGLVAQEVRAAIPSAARVMGDDPDGTLHLDPIALIAALIGAVTELAASNEAQSQTIEALRLRLGATDGEVTKLTVVDRLIERGSIHAALAALDSDPVMRARWDAAISVRVDDPLVVGLLTAIGEDPAVILAPMALA